MARPNFKTLSIAVSNEFMEHFNDMFQQSGSNSKGEFLRTLLENWLNPDYEGAVKKVEAVKNNEINEVKTELHSLCEINEDLEQKVSFYEATLKPLLDRVKGKKLKEGKKVFIIDTPEQLQKLLVTKFKIFN